MTAARVRPMLDHAWEATRDDAGAVVSLLGYRASAAAAHLAAATTRVQLRRNASRRRKLALGVCLGHNISRDVRTIGSLAAEWRVVRMTRAWSRWRSCAVCRTTTW